MGKQTGNWKYGLCTHCKHIGVILWKEPCRSCVRIHTSIFPEDTWEKRAGNDK